MPRRNSGPKLVPLKKRGGIYYIRGTENGRSFERSTGTRDLSEAKLIFGEFLRKTAQTDGPRDPAGFPIMDALEIYAIDHGRELTNPERVGYSIKALAPFFGSLNIADITPETTKAYCGFRGVSDGTLRRELGVLRAAINHVHRSGKLTRQVAVALPKKPQGKDRWLTRHEAAALLNAARGVSRRRLHLPLFILIGIYTGARKGAILGLRWPQIDLDRGRIDFNEPGRKRTNKGRPVIPIPRGLLWFLKKARERGSDLGYVINIDGQRIGDIKKSFNSACVEAELNDVTPHTLRHTAGTWMAQAGVPMWQIAGFLGHSHERTTELYSHHHADHLREAREALD